MRPPAFLSRAACKGMDVDIFFPHYFQHGAYRQARRICAQCPVTQECLQFALDTGTDDGMFGGTTPEERRRIRQERIPPGTFMVGHGEKAGTEAGYYREIRAGLPPCDDCAAAVRSVVARRARERKAAMA